MTGKLRESDSQPRRLTSQNPRYRGATPEDVARVLLRAPRSRRQPVGGDEVTVEKPLADQPRNDGSHLS